MGTGSAGRHLRIGSHEKPQGVGKSGVMTAEGGRALLYADVDIPKAYAIEGMPLALEAKSRALVKPASSPKSDHAKGQSRR